MAALVKLPGVSSVSEQGQGVLERVRPKIKMYMKIVLCPELPVLLLEYPSLIFCSHHVPF